MARTTRYKRPSFMKHCFMKRHMKPVYYECFLRDVELRKVVKYCLQQKIAHRKMDFKLLKRNQKLHRSVEVLKDVWKEYKRMHLRPYLTPAVLRDDLKNIEPEQLLTGRFSVYEDKLVPLYGLYLLCTKRSHYSLKLCSFHLQRSEIAISNSWRRFIRTVERITAENRRRLFECVKYEVKNNMDFNETIYRRLIPSQYR